MKSWRGAQGRRVGRGSREGRRAVDSVKRTAETGVAVENKREQEMEVGS